MAVAEGGCKWARLLGAEEVVVWSAYDGYDQYLTVRESVKFTMVDREVQAVGMD